MINEGNSHEKWRSFYGDHFLIGLAYIELKHKGNSEACQALLAKTSGENVPEFYQGLLLEIEADMHALAAKIQPDETELRLAAELDKDPENMEKRFELATHL